MGEGEEAFDEALERGPFNNVKPQRSNHSYPSPFGERVTSHLHYTISITLP